MVTTMRITAPKSRTLLLLVGILAALSVRAECRYPVADGGEPHPSAPNVVGTVTKVEANRIVLHTKAGSAAIRPPVAGIYYTAFGGDDRVGSLKPGLVARAWYVDCKSPKGKEMPAVAYLEVYSSDPKDRPPPSYWKRY